MRHSLFVQPLSFVVAGLVCLFATSCGNRRSLDAETAVKDSLRYATLLQMQETDSFTVVRIADAWNPDRLLATYVLVPDSLSLPSELPRGTVLRTPLRRVVAGSSVHAALLFELQCQEALTGICDAQYVIRSDLRQALSTGRLKDMGSSMQPNVEALLLNEVEAVLVSPYENATFSALETHGIVPIQCADYMETSALGRAEWMKFYGRLMGRAAEADSLFEEVVSEYTALSAKAKAATSRPEVVVDRPQHGTWYVPGGSSTIASLLADAGARYVFADNTEAGSLLLGTEEVFRRAQTANCWVIREGISGVLTRHNIAAETAILSRVEAMRTGRVYYCNVSARPYYEDTAFFPQRQLEDFVKIFHPEVMADHDLKYYEKVE